MQIMYHFPDEDVSIEVPEEWGAILIAFDEAEARSNRAETRRHSSLEGMEYEGEWFAAPNADVLEKILRRIDSEALRRALPMLTPSQQELVRRVFFLGERPSEIAAAEGVDKSAITHRLKRIYRQLKKTLP